MKDREEAGNIVRKCVIRFAREKEADLEMGGTQKGQEVLLSTRIFLSFAERSNEPLKNQAALGSYERSRQLSSVTLQQTALPESMASKHCLFIAPLLLNSSGVLQMQPEEFTVRHPDGARARTGNPKPWLCSSCPAAPGRPLPPWGMTPPSIHKPGNSLRVVVPGEGLHPKPLLGLGTTGFSLLICKTGTPIPNLGNLKSLMWGNE